MILLVPNGPWTWLLIIVSYQARNFWFHTMTKKLLCIGGGWLPTPPRAMRCIVWNCRELGNQLAVQEFVELVKAKTLSVAFLAETLVDVARLNYVKDRIRFDKKFFVQRINKGGGLVLFWKDDINIDVESSSLNYIDVTINKNSGKA